MNKFLLLSFIAILALALMGCDGEEAAGDENVYEDGTYKGYSDATDRGYVDAEVIIEDDAISDVTIRGFGDLGTEKPDDYPWEEYHQAIEELPGLYVERNHWDVDIITEATGTSNQANQAVYRALARARVEPTNQVNDHFDGTFMAISDETERGWTIVWVTTQNDSIVDVIIHETQEEDGEWVRKDEDYPWDPYHELLEVLPERIVEADSLDVEGVSEATGTYERALEAAERALEKAKR